MNYISLGYFCGVARDLEKLGLRSYSSPFDWMITDFDGVIRVINDYFEDFLNIDYLAQHTVHRGHYKNTKYNIEFFHDFDAYRSLNDQLQDVKDKYDRRIARFYKVIQEPTVFIRYIMRGELQWIEDNIELIFDTVKKFNSKNDILFIADEGVVSERIKIYNVRADENDTVARSPLFKNQALLDFLSKEECADKESNIERYKRKKKNEKWVTKRNYICEQIKSKIKKKYIHSKIYD